MFFENLMEKLYLRWKNPQGWPSDKEGIGPLVKPPQDALLSRQGIKRCGKGRARLYQVRFKEVKEKRLNHCRGIVKVIDQYLKSVLQYNTETSHVNVKSYKLSWQVFGVKMARP